MTALFLSGVEDNKLRLEVYVIPAEPVDFADSCHAVSNSPEIVLRVLIRSIDHFFNVLLLGDVLDLLFQPVFWRLGIFWLPAKNTRFGGWRLGLTDFRKGRTNRQIARCLKSRAH